MDHFASEEISDIAILVFRSSNLGRISTSFRLQFHICIGKLDKVTVLSRLRIVLRHSVLVHAKNLNDHITLLHGQPNFVYDPCTDENPVGNFFIRAIAILVVLGTARITRA